MAGRDKAFLGTGWSFPPTFSRGQGGVDMVSDGQDIHESLWILLSTTLGERIMVPNYGCQLWEMVFSSMTTTLATQIRDILSQAILYWEPRIEVENIAIEENAALSGQLDISVSYVIRKTNTRSNLVYPFYLHEASIPTQAS